MKKVFRSIINISKDGKPTIDPVELAKNYKMFVDSSIHAEEPSYIKLYHWIDAHFREYKEIPSIERLFEKAKDDGSETVLAALKDIAEQIPYIKSNFQSILKEKFELQNKDEFREVLKKTWQIVDEGLKPEGVGKKKSKELKGMKDALSYMAESTRKFRQRTTTVKTDSMILSQEDKNELLATYEKKRNDPLASIGMFTYLDKIDEVYRGVKLGDLVVIAAFTSQFKSTFASNLVYHGIMQGLNGMFVPLEVNFADSREFFYVMHTANPIWRGHPKYKDIAGKIDLKKVQYGELNDIEHEFFKTASEDFAQKGDKGDYGELRVWQPTEALTPSRLEFEVEDFQMRLAEVGKTLDFLVVDYVGLMVPDKEGRFNDFNTDLNNTIKKLKQMAIGFNDGRGLRVFTPFQVNREGWKDAAKNEGVYKLTALSNANEAERSADKVMTLFIAEQNRASGIVKFCCLKHRGGAFFQPFEVQVDYTNMKIHDVHSKAGDGMDIMDVGNSLPPLNA